MYYTVIKRGGHLREHEIKKTPAYLSNTLTNLCIAFYCILLYCVVLSCIVLLIYCYVDIIQYNAMHKFVGVLDNPQHQPQASAFYISRVFSNDRSVLSQSNTRLRLLHLRYDVDFTRAKQQNTLFYVLYSDKTWGFD